MGADEYWKKIYKTMKKKSICEQIADEIAAAVVAVIDTHKNDIKRLKRSKNIVTYWIDEGAHRGARIAAKKRTGNKKEEKK